MNPNAIPPAYWAACVQDELLLAPLMGWTVASPPEHQRANTWLFGTGRGEFRSAVGPVVERGASVPLPRWRRDTHALGDLLAAVPANVRWDDGLGLVHVWIDKPGFPPAAAGAAFDQHPGEGFALRKALVDLAIAYLTAKRRLQGGQG